MSGGTGEKGVILVEVKFHASKSGEAQLNQNNEVTDFGRDQL